MIGSFSCPNLKTSVYGFLYMEKLFHHNNCDTTIKQGRRVTFWIFIFENTETVFSRLIKTLERGMGCTPVTKQLEIPNRAIFDQKVKQSGRQHQLPHFESKVSGLVPNEELPSILPIDSIHVERPRIRV